MMAQQLCYWKGVAHSTSPEGKQMRLQHPEIPFRLCYNHCRGYDKRCYYMEIEDVDEVAVEDLVGRLEEIGI